MVPVCDSPVKDLVVILLTWGSYRDYVRLCLPTYRVRSYSTARDSEERTSVRRRALRDMYGPTMKSRQLLALGPKSAPLSVIERRRPEVYSCMSHCILYHTKWK